jgi:hypothetical protein
VQKELLPDELKVLESMKSRSSIKAAIKWYSKIRKFRLFSNLKFALLPKEHSKTLRTFHMATFS